MVDYRSNSDAQAWTVVRSLEGTTLLQGKSTPPEMVHTVCAIANRKGATVQE